MPDFTIPPMPILQGSRVRLRPLRMDDTDDFFALHSDARVMRYWSHPPWTDREQAIRRIEQLERDRATAEFYTWATTLAGVDRMIGTISLFAINRAQFRGEVGYALAPGQWGRGYATEGLRLAVEFAFGTIGLTRLEADVDPRNAPSCRVVERAGFQREGLLRQRWHVAGEITDSAMYGLLRDEYVAAR